MDAKALISNKDSVKDFAGSLTKDYIGVLVNLLAEDKDEIRNSAFQVLCERSVNYPDLYPYWDLFVSKLSDENAYQRCIGATLIAANVRWDKQRKFSRIFQSFISLCRDDNPMTARLTIQTIQLWAKYEPELLERTVPELTSIDISKFQASRQKDMLVDILNALITIREIRPSVEITKYLAEALSNGFLDKTSRQKYEKII